MRKSTLFVLAIFFAANVFGQYTQNQTMGTANTLVSVPANGGLRAALINRTFTDTTAANSHPIKTYPFAQIGTTGDGNMWVRNYLATGWVLLGGGTSPSGTFWRVGGNMFPVSAPTRDIGTDAFYGGAVGLMTSGVVRAIVPSGGFLLDNDTTSNKIFTWNPSTKDWGYANWNNGGGGATNLYGNGYQDSSDVVVFRTLNTNLTTIQNGWANFAGYSTYVTETPSPTGLRMVSTRTSYNYNSSVPLDTSWESAYNDVRIQIDFVLNSKGSSLPYIGTVMDGATNLYANNGFFVISLLDSSITFLTSSFGNFSCGTMARNIAAWDSIRLVHRRYFDVDYLTVYNFTNNTVETFNHSYGGSQSGCATTNIYPGLFIADMDITLKDYVFYGKGFQPDVLIVGASIQQNQMDVTDYDSSYAGRLNNLSGRKIGISAKCGNNFSDFQSNLREIRALKPKSVLLGDLGYNEIYVSAEAYTVWQPKYRAFIDSLISIGTRVVITRQTPNPSNAIPDTLNAFIDSVYSNHPKVQILDIYTLVDFYHPDSTNKAKASYFRDGIHWNNKPSKSVADQVRNQLERMERFNITGGTDVNFTRLNNSILLYQNTGTTKGQWNSFRLGSGFTVAGDSISAAGGGGGGSSAISSLTAAAATNDINNADYGQIWRWNSLGAGAGLTLTSNSTASTDAGHGLLGIDLQGANANSNQTTYAASFVNSHTGTTSTNIGLLLQAYGGTNNYPLDLGVEGSNLGRMRLNGSTSGSIVIQPAAAAGGERRRRRAARAALRLVDVRRLEANFFEIQNNSGTNQVFVSSSGQIRSVQNFFAFNGATEQVAIGYSSLGGTAGIDFGASSDAAIYRSAANQLTAHVQQWRWTGRAQTKQGADVASANNLSLGTDGNTFVITGATQINLISNVGWQDGSTIKLVFSGSVTVKNNQGTSGSNMNILLAGGADFAATANDVLILESVTISGTRQWLESSRSVN